MCIRDSFLWDDAKEAKEALWQIQLQHDTPDSLIVNLYDKFSKFLSESDEFPDTLEGLKKSALIKLVITGADDPDCIGTFRRYRPAFYVVGDEGCMKNLLYLLDDFWVWAHKERRGNTMISFHPHTGIDVDECWDNLAYGNYTFYPSSRSLTVSIFEAYPVQGKRILTMTLQIECDTVNIVFSGNLWPFRDRFDAEQIEMFRDDENKPFRVIPKCDDFEKILEIVPSLFVNTAMRVVCDGTMKPGSAVHSFVSKLRDNPQLFFA